MELNKPALEGGAPVRQTPLPYARHWLDEAEIQAATAALRSEWLTTGPRVAEFEQAVAKRAGVPHALAVTSCTAALHLAVNALGIGPGDEIITTPLTFCATALAAVYNGARPVFADIDEATLNIDPARVEEKITSRTRAILPMHYGGNPCDMDPIMEIARHRNLAVIEDAAHAIGATYKGRPIGAIGHATCYSFHAIKNMTTAEGGAVVTDDDDLAARLRPRRFFGINQDAWERAHSGKPWVYDVADLGFKYNMTDIQAAIGLVQIEKLEAFHARRCEIVSMYDREFSQHEELLLTQDTPDAVSAHHLYVIRIRPECFRVDRDHLLAALRAEGITANIHYIPVHLHTYFMKSLGTGPGLLPLCERAAASLITLPLFPAMTDRDARDTIDAVRKLIHYYRR